MKCQNCAEEGDYGKHCSNCGFVIEVSELPKRRIQADPIEPEHRQAMIDLIKHEHEPITSNSTFYVPSKK